MDQMISLTFDILEFSEHIELWKRIELGNNKILKRPWRLTIVKISSSYHSSYSFEH